MNNCRLCYDLRESPARLWNEPLFESKNFVVLPSLGALVEGWLLVVPKEHFICIGAIPQSFMAEMQMIQERLYAVVQEHYGNVCAFEHGPNRANAKVGCGVDHAHLHVAPVAFDLVSAVASFLPDEARWAEAGLEECRAAFNRGEDYLYLEQPIGVGRIATHQNFGSQLFRRAIANYEGVSDHYNWRDYPQLANVTATINKLRSLNGSPLICPSQVDIAA